MSQLPLGIISQGGATASPAFELISTTTLGAATSSITISSIPATYTSLQLRVVGRSANATIFDELLLRFNADSGANYGYKQIIIDAVSGSASSATAQTGLRIYGIHGNSATANNFAAVKMDITGHKDTNKKTSVRGFGGPVNFGASWAANGSLFGGIWNATTVVTSLTISAYSGANLQTGTRVSLYGVL